MALSCALCLAVAACASRPSGPVLPLAGSTADLVIVTWNVHGPAGDLTRLLTDLRTGRLTGSRPKAFVLLLQEAASDAVARAQRDGLFVHYEPIYPTRGNAIISTSPLVDTRAIELPRIRQRRVALVGWIDLEGTRVRVATTHLENRVSWWRGGLFSENARKQQAEALVAALPPGDPTILGGDFNAWLGRAEAGWQALAARFPDGPPPLEKPTFRQRLFLDELFFDLPAGWSAARLVISDRYGSDHHPMMGVLNTSPDGSQVTDVVEVMCSSCSQNCEPFYLDSKFGDPL